MRTGIVLLLLLALAASPASANPSAPPVDPELRAELKQAIARADSFQDRFDAEVWLLDMSTRMTPYIRDEQQRLRLLRLVHQAATRAGLKPDLVLAVMHVESLFDPYALSYVGAQGVMQVMPFWKAEIGRPDDNLIDLATNLQYGCAILKFYLDKENGNLRRALARYNGSLGSNRYPDKVLDYWYSYWYVTP
ncbi:MAG TPA: lytic transglycosylase domain-containing protein [Pseudomonas sp.]|jgi:soluble lytic murein transglycosylase-like protein|uniref:Transglycosylase n=1 Tax=Halopseudomonas pachastrellae TaxID=254161 RepID=A0A1S8DEF3_9GAMM|nr:lytic transglycosylase domain-containing protein [Halopseudomonas pachastrellae]MAB42775.1 transglycosylase [Pseudomonadales bacterium]MAQ50677.1 transglycosylase [Pseudomonas sp.]MBB50618.1 transglycosylase [Pseudomonadales bacterium]MBF77991.1 transglycosylase [Pseudomonadales bacterium]MBU31755.1 transglycosylase [Pseudomonadales bacterium]|tara:strand:+ start:1926 stop:2501 length:576 start_codon:yes stop_codon:yes gene_type:complete